MASYSIVGSKHYEQYYQRRKPKRVTVYCNGDKFFQGKVVTVAPHRYLSFNDLLNDFTTKFPGHKLPYGVRQVYTPIGGTKVRKVEDLKDGDEYVCGGFEMFKPMQYGVAALEPWRASKISGYATSSTYKLDINSDQSFQHYGGFHPNRHGGLRHSYGLSYRLRQRQPNADKKYKSRPRIINIVRNGPEPRSSVKILLNRQGVQSYEQLLDDVSEAFGARWKHDRVKNLYNTKGLPVHGLAEFFQDDQQLFVAAGREVITTEEVNDILKSVNDAQLVSRPDANVFKKTRKKHKRLPGKENDVIPAKLLIDSKVSKKDSGFHDSEVLPAEPNDQTSGDENKTNKQSVDLLHQSRLRAANEEKERAKKRSRKLDELEKKALEEESQKRHLVPMTQAESPLRKLERNRKHRRNKDISKTDDSSSADESKKVITDHHVLQQIKEEDSEKHFGKRSHISPKKPKKSHPVTNTPSTSPTRQLPKLKLSKEKPQDVPELVNLPEPVIPSHNTPTVLPQIKPAVQNGDKLSPTPKISAESKHEEKEPEQQVSESITNQKVNQRNKITARSSPDQIVPGSEITHTKDEKYEENTVRQPAKENKKPLAEHKVETDSAKVDSIKKNKIVNNEKLDNANKIADDKKRDQLNHSEDIVRQSESNKNNQKQASKKDENNNEIKVQPKPVQETKPTAQSAPLKPEVSQKRPLPPVKERGRFLREVSCVDRVYQKYEPGRVLGDGNFAIVRQSKQIGTRNEYAMKIIDKSKLRGKEHMVENEIRIMKWCNHQNIVKLFEEFETKAEIFLIMELVKGGDLFDAITQNVKFDEPTAASMVRDLANALFYLHSRKVVHRDLKPENLLVYRHKDGSMALKLGDFGLAMEVEKNIHTVCGTPTYVAPEILMEIGYGLEVDLWALGVITYIMLCGFPPFRSPDRKQSELFELIKSGDYEFLSPYWDKISDSVKDLISRLLVVNRKHRYTAVDVLCHPWVIAHGGARKLPSDLDAHRKQLRNDLETQGSENLKSWRTLLTQHKLQKEEERLNRKR